MISEEEHEALPSLKISLNDTLKWFSKAQYEYHKAL